MMLCCLFYGRFDARQRSRAWFLTVLKTHTFPRKSIQSHLWGSRVERKTKLSENMMRTDKSVCKPGPLPDKFYDLQMKCGTG